VDIAMHRTPSKFSCHPSPDISFFLFLREKVCLQMYMDANIDNIFLPEYFILLRFDRQASWK
jgi:hypothetical protein